VPAQNFPVLEWKCVERPPEVLLGQNERNGQAMAIPVARALRAGVEIAHPERLHQRETGKGCFVVAFDMRTIGDDRAKTAGKDAGEIRDERSGALPPRFHVFIRP